MTTITNERSSDTLGSPVRYATDGQRLYELHHDWWMRNYGRLGGWLRVVIVRDVCQTGEPPAQFACVRCDRTSGGDSWFRLPDRKASIYRQVAPDRMQLWKEDMRTLLVKLLDGIVSRQQADDLLAKALDVV